MIRIVTDSGCDLPKEVVETLGITVVPLQITFEDGSVAQDGIDITGDDFYAHMRSCKKLPTTSQPSPESFVQVFEEAKQAGDEVIAILIAEQLSGTYQCARLAAELAEYEQIHFVDSQNICLALGVLVQYAANLRDAGKTATEIVASLEHAKQHLHIIAVVDSLEYLRKGGRLPATAAIAGGLFGIKPLITVQEGKVSICGKARGLPSAYLTLFKKIDEMGGICKTEPYYMGYTLTKQEVAPIRRYFTQNLKLSMPSLGRVGSVIGVHAGPGAFGVAFFDNGLMAQD